METDRYRIAPSPCLDDYYLNITVQTTVNSYEHVTYTIPAPLITPLYTQYSGLGSFRTNLRHLQLRILL